MLSHVNIGARDVASLAPFYDAVLGVLGITRCFTDLPATAGWAREGGVPRFFIATPFNGGVADAGNGNMVAFLAADRGTVDAAYAMALAHGGTDEGPPGLRPHYAPGYYGAYVRDPEGNKIHFVHRGA